MKKIIFASLFVSLSVFSAPAKKVEAGLYHAVDVETGTVKAQLKLKTDGTLSFTLQAPDFEMEEPGCVGVYQVSGNQFKSDLTCPISIMPEVSVNIDISAVNPQSIRSEKGAEVPVVIDALSPDPTMFYLKIIELK